MKTTIKRAPGSKIEVNMFRRSDQIFLDLDGEQYVLSLKQILGLEDLDLRSTTTSN